MKREDAGKSLHFRISTELLAMLEEAAQRDFRGLRRQVNFLLSAMLIVAQLETKIRLIPRRSFVEPFSQSQSLKADLTHEEYEFLQHLARESGLSVSEQIRQLLELGAELSQAIPRGIALRKEEFVKRALEELQLRRQRVF